MLLNSLQQPYKLQAMRAVIQRVKKASCVVDGKITGQIGIGALILLGVKVGDTEKNAEYLVEKIANVRIFQEGDKEFDKSLLDIKGEVLVISQFTLYADAASGRRPDFIDAAKGNEAEPLYRKFIDLLKAKGLKVEEGIFGAMMDIELLNSGPVTIIIDSRENRTESCFP